MTPTFPHPCLPLPHETASGFRRAVPTSAFLPVWGLLAVFATGCGDPEPSGPQISGGDIALDVKEVSGGDGKGDGSQSDTPLLGECKVDADCPAAPGCQTVRCEKNFCVKDMLGDGTVCDDKDPCTHTDLCKAGKCKGKLLVCNDDNECTEDFCEPVKGCSSVPVVKPCTQKDDPCTARVCSAGQCIVDPGAKPCDDGNPCTQDSCDPKTGCQYSGLTGVPCDDGSNCTKNDQCKLGQCLGLGKSCDDGNLCTNDGCDAKGGCVHTPGPEKTCNDGNLCTAKDKCTGGSCKGTPKNCDDGDPCSADTCSAQTGLCDHSPLADAAVCDDGNACTSDDVCGGGTCTGKAKACDDGNPCTSDDCDTATGQCGATPVGDGTVCGGSACQATGTCQQGTCGGIAVDCDDGNPCTVDKCSNETGGCTHANLPDGDKCGDGKSCQSGVCS